jgi:hypothetical protein
MQASNTIGMVLHAARVIPVPQALESLTGIKLKKTRAVPQLCQNRSFSSYFGHLRAKGRFYRFLKTLKNEIGELGGRSRWQLSESSSSVSRLFRLFQLEGRDGCNAQRAQALFSSLSFRSRPPLPTIFLIGRHLAKTRGGKRGQITSMIRFVREISAARVTAGSRRR